MKRPHAAGLAAQQEVCTCQERNGTYGVFCTARLPVLSEHLRSFCCCSTESAFFFFSGDWSRHKEDDGTEPHSFCALLLVKTGTTWCVALVSTSSSAEVALLCCYRSVCEEFASIKKKHPVCSACPLCARENRGVDAGVQQQRARIG